MKIRTIEPDVELADEVLALYGEATTKEAYERTMERGNKAMTTLKNESSDVMTPILLPGLWANHDFLLKFPNLSSMTEDRKRLLGRVEWWLSCDRVKSLENRVALVYLKSMILKNLLDNYSGSRRCIIDIEKIIEEEESVSIALTLELINARGATEMANKNWTEAVRIFNEINEFPEEIFWQPENSRAVAKIFSNRGLSLIRVNPHSIWSGIQDLAIAGGHYQQQKEPPKEYVKNLKSGIEEAMEKL